MGGGEQIGYSRRVVLVHLAALGLYVKPHLFDNHRPRFWRAIIGHLEIFSIDYTNRGSTCTIFSMADDKKHVYRIYFHNQGQIYEVYAHSIYQSDLYGFVEIEDYVFGEKSQMVIDPSEDKLRTEFAGVQRSFIPIHAIVRVDEVEKEGTAKITDSAGATVTPFPLPMPDKKG
tara:strand:- start:508 stop:1026 length:519 start_codon:yes stop_codon:yes gene_type:complete